MNHAVDPGFRLRRQANIARRRRALLGRALGVLGVLSILAAGGGLYVFRHELPANDIDEDLQAAEGTVDLPADAPVYVPAIVDLAGDPMWINLGEGSGAISRLRQVGRPADLPAEGISPQISVLSDVMLSATESFMTTIPSTQEDFAFFQAQRRTPAPPAGADAAGPEPQGSGPAGSGDDDLDVELQPSAEQDSAAQPSAPAAGAPEDEEDAGWGGSVDGGEAGLPAFRKTAIENNTSVATVAGEHERYEATHDYFVRIYGARGLDGVAADARFPAEDGRLAAEALKKVFGKDGLEAGYVVAMRGFRPSREAAVASLVQVSVYSRDSYIGTLARGPDGSFVQAADPWVREDLFNYAGASQEISAKRQYRLLDAIYSTAARNDVPTGVVGEAIMYLSRGQDLNAFASYDQRLVLIYSQTPRSAEDGSGRVLYVGIVGRDSRIDCFVYRQGDGQYACVTGNDQVRSLSAANGMVTPVSGVLTSTFGPRKHPILGVVRVHKGVDWAAPAGTPVAAAFDGQIVFQGDGHGYGNVVRIAHSGGRETRYAHLQRFAIADGTGKTVKAGDIIGYIGTTGLSTGPHLHFELYVNGEAVDPLGNVTTIVPQVAAAETPAPAPIASSDADEAAVETLTDRIIHVESGGSSHAKNPRSSATGLGQFISSTWVRMMNTYRPDLARSLSQADLLALRFDPTISREMVRNLAREGEAYLKARGHKITAGRLYLCHFLGMEGAHQVLAASGSSMLGDLLGSGVIQANPFLTGKTASYVVDWAERKMNRKGYVPSSSGSPSPAPPVAMTVQETSPEFMAYKRALEGLVASVSDST
ncbi:MAG: M23 family metallopeptidase [Rhizobiales bacterium]|nr:M23 family metallopeptidase [Hyphomicrobiales bacterium]